MDYNNQEIYIMGKKAKNAGKKQSKTCDKPANSRRLKCSGARIKLIQVLNDDEIGQLLFNDKKSQMLCKSKHKNYGVNSHKIIGESNGC